MRGSAIVVIASILCLAALQQGRSVAQKNSAERTISLSGAWQFRLARDAEQAQALEQSWQNGRTLPGFQEIPVPSNWSMHGIEEPTYAKLPSKSASEGFYVKHFTLASSLKGQRVLLHFGGVWDSAEVWLNDTNLGRHDSGFTSFSFDVTPSLRGDADNVLAVRVRQVNHDYLFDVNDDWSLPGIYRDVTLEAMPADRWIDKVDIRTSFDGAFRDADLNVRVLIADSRPRNTLAAPYELSLSLKDGHGTTVVDRRMALPSHTGTDRLTDVTLHVISPQKWSAEKPNLYTLSTELIEGGQVTHAKQQLVGFREVSTAGGVLRVNGQAVKLRGVNRHDESATSGRATTPSDWERDIRLMKDANINFVRSSHYPPAQGFLDLCDREGLYVEDEVPMGYGGDAANDPSYIAATMLRVAETLNRDINHPSIIMWSVGNEDPLTQNHLLALRTVKGLDPTRPVLLPWRAEEALPREVDIIAPHYLTAEGFDQLAAQSTRPVFATEYSHAYGTEGFGGLQDRWLAITRHPAGAGGAIWMWADQGLRRTNAGALLNKDGSDGIVDMDRVPQRDYWETKAVYATVYPETAVVRLASGATEITIPIKNDFDFVDLKEVKIAWQIMTGQQQVHSGEALLEGHPHTTSSLVITSRALLNLTPAQPNYVVLRFERDGREIATRSVEIQLPPLTHPRLPTRSFALDVKSDNNLKVTAGLASYTFDKTTGRLGSTRLGTCEVLTGVGLTLWRPLNDNEVLIQPKGDKGPFPDLDDPAKDKVTGWVVTQDAQTVLLKSSVERVIDPANSLHIRYTYTVASDGSLTVHYEVTTKVHQRYLSFTGLRLTSAKPFMKSVWTGLGPIDTFPNEAAAGRFGEWTIDAGDALKEATKRAQSIKLQAAEGPILHITGDSYLRLTPDTVAVLSQVAGRPSKGSLPEDPTQRLSTENGSTFTGEFKFNLTGTCSKAAP